MSRWLVGLALLGGLSVACSKSEEPIPTCAQVTEHLYSLMQQAYPGHGDMGKGNRKAEIAACEKQNMPAAERRCYLAAKDMASGAKCRKPAEDKK